MTLQCDDLVFELCFDGQTAMATISEPNTLCGMIITVGEKVTVDYKGLVAEIPESACKRITVAVKAVKAVNNGIADKGVLNSQEILTYTLDLERYQVYYKSDTKKIVGFIADGVYYGVKD